MQNVFDADDNFVPFFNSTVVPYAGLSFSPDLSECHVPGRHLNALLMAEAVAGVAVDPDAIENHRRAMRLSFSGPVCLPLNRQVQTGPVLNFSPVNLREGLHALYALVRYRGDSEAQHLAERFLAEINRLWNAAVGWDVARFEALGLTFQPVQGPVNGEARMLGPLTKYYRATGSPAALDLALRITEVCLERFFQPDGRYSHERFITDHAHSITSTLSSLAEMADLLSDARLLQRVKAFYDNGLWEMRDEIGWCGGAVYQPESDRGEASCGGDMLETALILGRHGYPEYYADAERILRCHLLPSQLRDISFMRDDPRPNPPDGLRDASNRHLGAWGVPAPYGHLAHGLGPDSIGFYMDIVGSVVGSICAALAAAVITDQAGHHLNLLFDHDGPSLRVTCLTAPDGLEVLVKQPAPLWIRLPPWVAAGDVRLAGADTPPVWLDGCLFIAQPPVGTPLRLLYPLPQSTLSLSSRVHSHPIRLRLRGDRPLAMDNFGMDLTYFEPFDTPAP